MIMMINIPIKYKKDFLKFLNKLVNYIKYLISNYFIINQI